MLPIKDPVKLFTDYLRSRGKNVTEARKRIVEEVFKIHHHFDAGDLWTRLRDKTSLSISTIYRTLDLLVDSGLVNKVDLGTGQNFYEHVFGHQHHDHLICTNCGKVIEFSDPELEENLQTIIKRHGFKEEVHDLKIVGLCEECQKGS